ncbi:Uncharacterised protein [Serratia grimesii]|uniref:hypothetical protein n=1 Tax=Serratia grimesii TaxID=82995 RepID=UPI0021790076|nr:hypothetical protein [Serratia grimesii]CAI1836912.1 Uncharacterised protein [Serratia grimesii]
MKEKTTVYITKYALTQGIKKEEGELRESGYFSYGTHFVVGPADYRLTLEGAISKAEDMRRRKIAYMEEKLCQLGSMKFEVKP